MLVYPKLLLRCPFEITQVADETFAVGVGEGEKAFNGIIKLENETTLFIFNKLIEGITLPDLLTACLKEYEDSTVEEIGPPVIAFLDQLREQGLLAADPQNAVADKREDPPKKLIIP